MFHISSRSTVGSHRDRSNDSQELTIQDQASRLLNKSPVALRRVSQQMSKRQK
ncbi:MAG TPA: hypothetical protein V6C90_21675 [Coleofasciculaceae cyanobacterium]